MKVAIALVGDSACMFASAAKVYTKDSVTNFINAAIQCELQNSAPRDMTPDERGAYVRAGLDRFLFKDFAQG